MSPIDGRTADIAVDMRAWCASGSRRAIAIRKSGAYFRERYGDSSCSARLGRGPGGSGWPVILAWALGITALMFTMRRR